ncbi:hypoxanthine phosphoribosyltransferase [Mycoplasma nasistruthionis]|uniref:Hypoxanthine phosphoribosyltransferase n=1 Tax=Mycoplasma nasistruthionis TaxID=353852 RepID=A0A4Y6I6S6_9MOLU|nr:hypoxanthine phosphoribosyltransferase [Mycoplasma nasistruthionis]QCZ36802.1 hypoxanthine phosphoribosyltransferase [Mycoplasma nasistruthionis]QDF65081.1 hypoxanthine phosphoribosyltransferase [Mycoplasma nasistruthionis]
MFKFLKNQSQKNSDIHPAISKVIYSKTQLEDGILKAAKWVDKTYQSSQDLIIVGLLKGSIPFLAQLIKDVKTDHRIDFLTASSYAGGLHSTGSVKIIMDLASDIQNKDVLIVEDIIDSGITLAKITELLRLRNPKSIKILTLLDKPVNRKNDLKADYSCFTVGDEFLVGFGLDYKEKYRNLPYIGVLNTDPVYLENNNQKAQ